MRVLHEAVQEVVGHLQKYELTWFVKENRELVESKSVPLVVSYACDISNAKGMLAVHQGAAVNWPCVRYMMAGADIISGKMVGAISIGELKTVRSRFLE